MGQNYSGDIMQNSITSWTAGICAIAGLALTGCVTTYQAPTDPALSAKVDVYKGYKAGVGFGTGTSQEYSIYTSEGCDEPQRLAAFTWTSGKKKEKTVAANTPLRIGAFTSSYSKGEDYYSTDGRAPYWNGMARSINATQYPSYAVFTPVAGAKYKITQNENDEHLFNLEIIDLATSEAPKDLVIGFTATCMRQDETAAQ